MAICDFAGIFSILLRYATGLGKDELYSKIFMSYYEYEGDPSVLTAYTANKVLKGQKYLDRKGKKFYVETDNYTMLYDDLNERVFPYVSDKFGMCNEIRQLIISDGMNEADRIPKLRTGFRGRFTLCQEPLLLCCLKRTAPPL